MARIAADITWLVGHTPLVELARLSPPGCRVVGKLESWNPSGSNKDRAALGMIRHAARSGCLREGGTIVAVLPDRTERHLDHPILEQAA